MQECIALDAGQKGHQISEDTAKELLDKGLIEGESPKYQISLGVAKITHQLPEYTRVSGLERSKLKQMALQFIRKHPNSSKGGKEYIETSRYGRASGRHAK